MSNVNMSVPKSNFQETVVLYDCKVFLFVTFVSWKVIVGYCVIYYVKILNYFGCMEYRILVEEWNIYEVHIFPRSLVQKW